MSTRAVNCLILVCDGCGKDYRNEYTEHFDTVTDAHDSSTNWGEWRTDGEQDWCPDCQLAPHQCTTDPEDRQTCARCTNPIEAGES